VRFIPLDVDAYDAAIATGRTLLEVAPSSAPRLALQAIAAGLSGTPLPRRRRRLPFARQS